MARYDIIVPVYNQGELTKKCLESIKKYSKDYRAIIVDNGSDSWEYDKWGEAFCGLENKWLIVNEENLGFVKAINQGLNVSTAPYVVFLNNDAEAAPQWLQKLEFPFLRDSKIGAVSALSGCSARWQGKIKPSRGYRIVTDHSMVSFFCAMIPQKIIKETGLLNEEFGLGLGDDNEYCWRLTKAGYKLALAMDLKIPHKGSATFRAMFTEEERIALSKENLGKFAKMKGAL